MFDIKREDVFLPAINYLLENDEEQLAIHDLKTKMGQLCENPFSFKHMKRRLLDYFGKSYNYCNEGEAKHNHSLKHCLLHISEML